MKEIKKSNSESSNKKITRKQAIKKVGYTALTAASLMLLTTKANASASAPTAPGWGG